MKDWHKLKPELFKKQPYYLTGCDTSSAAQDCGNRDAENPIQNRNISLLGTLGPVNTGVWGRKVIFTVTNNMACTISDLKIVVVGRNGLGQITVLDNFQIFYSETLPTGLMPAEEMIAQSLLPNYSSDFSPLRDVV